MKVLSSTLKSNKEQLELQLDLLFLEHPSYRDRNCSFLAEQINQHFIGEKVTAKEVFLVDEPSYNDLIEDARLIYKNYYDE